MNGSLTKNPGGADETSWPSKFTGYLLEAGGVLRLTTPNSGGYGDPLERDPELVLSDVLDGFTSVEQAREAYLVVIDPETMTLDLAATKALREGAPVAGC